MPSHVAILLKPYIRLILAGRKTIESRLTIRPIPPFRAIAAGDRLYFKASSGPYMATAVAERVEFFENLTPAKISDLKERYNREIHGEDAYWQWKRNSRCATLIWLKDVEATGDGPVMKPSSGIAWFVMKEDAVKKISVNHGRTRGGAAKRGLPRLGGVSRLEKSKGVELSDFITKKRLKEIIQAAKVEDMGPGGDDITSRLMVPAHLTTTARMVSRSAGVLSGAGLLRAVAWMYDKSVSVEVHLSDGSTLRPGDAIATLRGPLRSILAIERVALNFCTHLSGIATTTARYVREVEGTRAAICDTRKTLPGLRELEKYAVVCGGGASHRMGLHDAVLVKDNHIAHLGDSPFGLAQAVREMIVKVRLEQAAVKFIEVEVDDLDQLRSVLPCRPDIVLLDNMPPDMLREAVAMRDQIAPGVRLEASGGVNLMSVAAIAQSGVDRISVGALTHSAAALDIGLDIEKAKQRRR